jgi:hypothetical protein
MQQLMSPFGTRIPRPATTSALAPRPESLKGLRLGLLNNGKRNADLLLEQVLAELAPELEPSAVIRRRKPGAGVPGPQNLLDELRAECDAVIVGVGD